MTVIISLSLSLSHSSKQMELAFRTGDVIFVYGDMDEDGFFLGEVSGIRGLVPSNFLSDAGPVDSLNVNVRHVSRPINNKGGEQSK